MIVRGPRQDRFTVLNRGLINDSRLSYRALGILTYILDKPDNWRIDSTELARDEGREGRDAVRKALTELEEAGYLRRTKVRRDDGTFDVESTIYDQPVETSAGEPAPGNPAPVDQAPLTSTENEHCNDGVASQRAARPRNDLFDALVVACGMAYDEMTDPARKRTGIACAQLAKVGATPEEVHRRAEIYQQIHTASLTPTALASQWAACREVRAPAAPTRLSVMDQARALRAAREAS